MRHIRLIIALVMALTSLASKAYDFKYGECYYNITSLSDLTVALTNSGEVDTSHPGGDTYVACYSGDFTVPQTAEYSNKTFRVTSVDYSAFQDCDLDKLTIPTYITSAGISGKVQKLIIEDSDEPLTALSASYVKEAYIGRNVGDPEYSSAYSFYNSIIEKAEFGNSVTFVPGEMFGECESLESVSISDNVRAIYGNAFQRCPKLKTISAANVEFIGVGAFEDCVSLESFYFPNLITINDGNYNGYGGVFHGCVALKNIDLPDGLTTIGTYAFADCSSLESVKLPGTIVALGGSTFSNCARLKEVSIAAKNPISIPENTFDSQTYINATLKVPAGSLELYKKAEIWSNFFNIEEDPTLVSTINLITLTNHDFNCGTVEINGVLVDSYAPVTLKIQNGETVNLKFNPFNGYGLRKVLINDEDVTDQVDGNRLTLTNVDRNLTIAVEFDELPIYLSIKQADNGCAKLEVNRWTMYKFVFVPESDWEIHAVSFNGDDVTGKLKSDNSFTTPYMTGDSELIVTYVNSSNAIQSIKDGQSAVRVIGSEGRIVVSNASEGEIINVYSISGMLLHSTTASDAPTTIDVTGNQVYIVTVGNVSYKIAL